MNPKTQKRKAARKLRRWRNHKPPRLWTEKHWRNRIRKGRLPMRRRTHVVCWEGGSSFMLNLKTGDRVYLTDWLETTTYSTVRI